MTGFTTAGQAFCLILLPPISQPCVKAVKLITGVCMISFTIKEEFDSSHTLRTEEGGKNCVYFMMDESRY